MVEGARLESVYTAKVVSRVRIPLSPQMSEKENFSGMRSLGFVPERSGDHEIDFLSNELIPLSPQMSEKENFSGMRSLGFVPERSELRAKSQNSKENVLFGAPELKEKIEAKRG